MYFAELSVVDSALRRPSSRAALLSSQPAATEHGPAHNIAVFLREKGLDMLLRLLRKAQPAVAECALNLVLQMSNNQNVRAFVFLFAHLT